jgi:hypothetical protein
MFFRVQSQCKPNAESLLFAEVKPDFAVLFLEKRCKGTTFFLFVQIFADFS